MTSLPVPVSPTSSTALSTGATIAIASVTSRKAALLPISCPAMPVPPQVSGVVRRPRNVLQQFAAVERFHQEGHRTIPQRLATHVVVVMSSDEDHRQLTPFASNPPLEFRPIDSRQAHV